MRASTTIEHAPLTSRAAKTERPTLRSRRPCHNDHHHAHMFLYHLLTTHSMHQRPCSVNRTGTGTGRAPDEPTYFEPSPHDGPDDSRTRSSLVVLYTL